MWLSCCESCSRTLRGKWEHIRLVNTKSYNPIGNHAPNRIQWLCNHSSHLRVHIRSANSDMSHIYDHYMKDTEKELVYYWSEFTGLCSARLLETPWPGLQWVVLKVHVLGVGLLGVPTAISFWVWSEAGPWMLAGLRIIQPRIIRIGPDSPDLNKKGKGISTKV